MKATTTSAAADFDALIVEKLVVPQLEKRGKFTDLLAQMKKPTGHYNVLWYSLLHKAEEAKIALSTGTSAEIDLSFRSVIDEEREGHRRLHPDYAIGIRGTRQGIDR